MKRTLRDLAIPGLVLLVFMLPLAHGFTDDGFIHVQYAKNLMTRGEYSFNPGETSFGTTSPLWVLALASVARPFGGGDTLVHASRALSWLAAFATLGVFLLVMRSLGASRRAAVCATIVLAADAWFARWSALAMESSTATLAATLVVLASVRAFESPLAAMRFGVATAIGALIRPELYLALPVFVLAAFTVRPRPALKTVAAGLVVAALLLAPWLLFAKWHIGSFLPNTAGAKSGGIVTDPLVFVTQWIPLGKIVASTQAVSALAMLADLAWSRRRAFVLAPGFRFAALWMVILPLAYVVADIQVLSRYLLLILPAVCAGGFGALVSLAPRLLPALRSRVVVAACAVSVVANAVFYARVVVPPSRAFSADLQGSMTGLALYLRDHSDPDAVVAAADIGYLAFYSGRRVLDLGGLVEPKTAVLREAHDYETIVEEGLYFGVPGYPRVDYLVDREHEPARFDGRVVAGHRFERVYMTKVSNLGIRKPGEYYYTLYHITPVSP